MLTRARFLTLLAPGIVAGCVLPEQGGGNISVGGNHGTGGFDALGGFKATGGASNNTQDTGGSVNASHTGGSPATGGSTAVALLPTGGMNGSGGSSHSCASGVAGNASSCICIGGCAGSGGHIPCPSGWINNKDQTCTLIKRLGFCDPTDAVPPPTCDDASDVQNRCLITLPEYSLHATKVALTEDTRILSLGATVGPRSTPFRVAIYSDAGGHPNAPVVQAITNEQLTYARPIEKLDGTKILAPGDYWLTILADHGDELSVYLVADEFGAAFDSTVENAGGLNGMWDWPQGPDLAPKLFPYTSSRPLLFRKSQLHVFAEYVPADTSPSN